MSPQRCKVFLWLALHNKLLTNTNREKRGLTNDPLCPVCELEYEDVDHVIRRCPEAQIILDYFYDQHLGVRGDGLDFRTWVKKNVLNEQGGADWPTKFTIIAWYIWKWRNAICFDSPENMPIDKISFLLRRFAEVLKALDGEIRG